MYLVALHGHGRSASPGASGAPTLCSPGTNSPSSPSSAMSSEPHRVMTCIDATTYGESVSSTPSIGSDAVNGPMQYGMTYIVRPRMQLRNKPVRRHFISSGSTQLFVITASRGSRLQMKVRSSTRATSDGSERHQNESGFNSGLSRTNVPDSTSSSVIRRHSAADPSTHTTRSGWVNSAQSRTQANSLACVVGGAFNPGIIAITPDHHTRLFAPQSLFDRARGRTRKRESESVFNQ